MPLCSARQDICALRCRRFGNALLKFQIYNVVGAIVWVVGLVLGGYFFGNIPIIRDHLNTIVLLGIAAAVVPLVLGGLWKFYKKTVRSS